MVQTQLMVDCGFSFIVKKLPKRIASYRNIVSNLLSFNIDSNKNRVILT